MSEQRASYPDLYDFTPAPAPAASAPTDNEWQTKEVQFSLLCGICKQDRVVDEGSAYVVLTCRHKAHIQCVVGLPNIKERKNRVGGVGVCQHCLTQTLRTGVYSSNDPELDVTACLMKMNQLHIEKSGIDGDAIMRIGITDEIAQHITGDYPKTAPRWAGVSKVMNLLRASENGDGDDDDVPNELPPTLPRGDDLVKYLNSKKPPRTIDNMFDTLKISLPHLFIAGIDSMEQLCALGFDYSRHLTVPYRPVLPPYMLVQGCEMSYDRHLSHELTPNQIAEMGFSKRELFLMGITIGKLILTGKCTKKTLFAFDLPPSSLIKFAGLELVHLKLLKITPADFDSHPKWAAEKAKNLQIRELVSRL